MANKTVGVPEQFREAFGALVSLDQKQHDLKSELVITAKKLDAETSALWSMVEKHFDCRGQAMSYDRKTKTITIHDMSENQDAALLDKIRAGHANSVVSKKPMRVDIGAPLPGFVGFKKPNIFKRADQWLAKKLGW